VFKSINVVIAAYNAEPYIDFCLTGVLHQTQEPDRVVVVDDASNDRTAEILESWRDRLPLTILRNEENIGPGASRARALSHLSDGKVALLDADDFWLPEHLDALLRIATSTEIIAVPKAKIWQSGSGILSSSPFERPLPVPSNQFRSLAKSNPVFTGSMFDLSAVSVAGGYPSNRLSEDYLFWYRCLKNGMVLVQAGHATVLYRRHTHNVSGMSSDFFSATAGAFQKELSENGSDVESVIKSIIEVNEVRRKLSAGDEGKSDLSRLQLLRLVPIVHWRLRFSLLYRAFSRKPRNRYQKIR
jgi:glycosyltransferase involved in cell wall biosynthesis